MESHDVLTSEGNLWDSQSAGDPRCLVVMYHYVRDTTAVGPAWQASLLVQPVSEVVSGLTPQAFRTQLDRLCHELEPIDWPRLYAWTEGRSSLPERCFLLTFDDGLADHARTVLPILQERGLRGVFFVSGETLAGQRMLPAHAVHVLLAALGEERFTQELERYLAKQGGAGPRLATVPESAARTMYHYEPPARARLKYLLTVMLPTELRAAAVEALFARHIGSTQEWAGDWYLGWDDLIELESLGHTIGGHGFEHEPYLRWTPAQRRRDLRRSAAVLRDGLGAGIRPFSYPYGSFDEEACVACRDAGFAHAFTTRRRWIARGCDWYRLPRIDTIFVDAALTEERACQAV